MSFPLLAMAPLGMAAVRRMSQAFGLLHSPAYRLFLALSPLTHPVSQSKLSPTQLDELQRATHFDKKELQQWYKGMAAAAYVIHARR